jgi:hypothetical protein
MKKKIEVTIPASINEMPLEAYQRLAKLDKEEMTDFFQILSCITGHPINVLKHIKAKDTQRAINALVKGLHDVGRDVPLIKYYTDENTNTEYACEPKLDDLDIGMVADISGKFDNPDLWHEAVAILYRKVTKKVNSMGGLYQIEPHDHRSDSYKERKELFKKAPASLFVGVRAFFLNGLKDLNHYIQASLTHQDQKVLSKKMSTEVER